MQIKTKNDIYHEAIDILTSQGKFYINLGLERVQAILKIIGSPEKKMKFIHVAGTNGKGSVCTMLSSILTDNNYKAGLFTSPHVFEYIERIKINETEIAKEVFAQKVINIVEISQKNDMHLTEFEILTVVAFEYFVENNVDIVILETGLGGRLDATNVIEENICSIITNIDFDHTERLGDTIEKIAYEKAGIIKENCPVVISQNNTGFDIIKKIAEEKNSDILCSNPSVPNFLKENSALKGTYQKENLALVLTAIESLNKSGFKVAEKLIKSGLKNVKHPCRFEYLKEFNILIDGAHNPNGAKVLRQSLDYYFPNQKMRFIFGCLKNKNYQEMMKNLFTPSIRNGKGTTIVETLTPEIYFYEFDNPNSCSYGELASVCEFNSKPFDEFKSDNNTLTVVCGSFYMIKELLTKINIK